MKLREEIYTIATDNPTLDDLNSLPYLDRVIRETLRLYPFTPFTMRESMRDSAIPLSKPFTDTKGIVHSEIRLVFILQSSMYLSITFQYQLFNNLTSLGLTKAKPCYYPLLLSIGLKNCGEKMLWNSSWFFFPPVNQIP